MRLIDKAFEVHVHRLLGQSAPVTDVHYEAGLITFRLPLGYDTMFRTKVELASEEKAGDYLLCSITETSLSDQLDKLDATLSTFGQILP
ncbi:hypothetical protein [Spirosoma aerophilum]